MSFLSMGLWMVASGIAPAIMPSAYASYWPLVQQQGMVIQTLQTPSITRDISIVTKAGGFGDEFTLRNAVAFLRGA